MKKFTLIAMAVLSLYGEDSYYEYGKKIVLTKMHDTREHDAVKYYQSPHGEKIGVKDEIILKCKEPDTCKEVLAQYHIDKIENLTNTLFLIKVPKDENIFDLSRRLYNEEAIVFAHPNFIKQKKRR